MSGPNSSGFSRYEIRRTDETISTDDLEGQLATEILKILKRLNKDSNKTIIMATHDPHAASYAHIIRILE